MGTKREHRQPRKNKDGILRYISSAPSGNKPPFLTAVERQDHTAALVMPRPAISEVVRRVTIDVYEIEIEFNTGDERSRLDRGSAS